MRLVGFALSALIATVAGPQPAASQASTRGAVVRGNVIDSLSRTPLPHAVVQLVATDNHAKLIQSATSDSLGYFELSDVAPGHYALGFVHPLLDSLGIELPLREVYVDSSLPRNADLAIPSPATLKVAVCGQSRDSRSVVIGVVRDAVDRSPSRGITVSAEWLELALRSTGFAQRLQRVKATTDANGWFSICNAPGAGTIGLLATSGTDSTDLIEMQMPADGFIRRDLYLGASRSAPSGVSALPADSLVGRARRVHVGDGRLTGTVVTVVGKRPLGGAQVSIVDGPQTRTNEQGEWTLVDAPRGTRMLDIRALGYYPERRLVNVVAEAPPVAVELPTLKAVLDTVKISASRLSGDRDGFMRRRRIGGGHFLSPSDIARFPAVVTSDLFRTIPGVRTTLRPDGQRSLEVRGMFQEWCSPAIFVDGHNMSFMDGGDIDDYVRPERVAGIEVYSGAVVPADFQVGLNGCGSVVIWTR